MQDSATMSMRRDIFINNKLYSFQHLTHYDSNEQSKITHTVYTTHYNDLISISTNKLDLVKKTCTKMHKNLKLT